MTDKTERTTDVKPETTDKQAAKRRTARPPVFILQITGGDTDSDGDVDLRAKIFVAERTILDIHREVDAVQATRIVMSLAQLARRQLGRLIPGL